MKLTEESIVIFTQFLGAMEKSRKHSNAKEATTRDVAGEINVNFRVEGTTPLEAIFRS